MSGCFGMCCDSRVFFYRVRRRRFLEFFWEGGRELSVFCVKQRGECTIGGATQGQKVVVVFCLLVHRSQRSLCGIFHLEVFIHTEVHQ